MKNPAQAVPRLIFRGGVSRIVLGLLISGMILLSPARSTGSDPATTGGSAAARLVSLSLDDGMAVDRSIAVELASQGISVTFFLNNHSPALASAREISRLGHEIGGHSSFHRHLSTLTVEETFYSLMKNRMILEEASGQEVVSFAYPFVDTGNRYTRECLNRAGYRVARAGRLNPHLSGSPGDEDLLRVSSWHLIQGEMDQRLQELLSLQSPARLSLWAHGNDLDLDSGGMQLLEPLIRLHEQGMIQAVRLAKWSGVEPGMMQVRCFPLLMNGQIHREHGNVESMIGDERGGTLSVSLVSTALADGSVEVLAAPCWNSGPLQVTRPGDGTLHVSCSLTRIDDYRMESAAGTRLLVLQLDGKMDGVSHREYYTITSDVSDSIAMSNRFLRAGLGSLTVDASPRESLPRIVGEYRREHWPPGQHPAVFTLTTGLEHLQYRGRGWKVWACQLDGRHRDLVVRSTLPLLVVDEDLNRYPLSSDRADWTTAKPLQFRTEKQSRILLVFAWVDSLVQQLPGPWAFSIRETGNPAVRYSAPSPVRLARLLERCNREIAGTSPGDPGAPDSPPPGAGYH